MIVPVYNGMRTLAACVESLLALAPESPAHEIVFVDNGSTDGSLESLQSRPRIIVVKEHHTRGPSAARNAGAHASSGTILAFTDVDCVVTPRWLIGVATAFKTRGVVGVGGRIEGIEPRNEIQSWMNARKILDQEHALHHKFMPFIQTANASYRRKEFMQVGGFDTSLLLGEDCDLSWRIQRDTGGRLAYQSEALVYHDHRCSVRGLYRQSRKNAMADALLAKKWASVYPLKSWKTSVWECGDILQAIASYAAACCTLSDRKRRANLRLDMLHRIARKHGMILSAWQTRQWNRW